MSLPPQTLDRLRSLPIWNGPIEVTPLLGGITNQNYLIQDRTDRYAARISRELVLLGVDRRNEVACQEAAAGLGVGPEVVYREDGVLISRYLPGRTLDAGDVREPATIRRVARLLQKLHGAEGAIAGHFLYFCPFQTIRTYARTAATLGARFSVDLSSLLEDARILSGRVRPFRPSLCHNDLLPANLIDHDARLWLVDWEYAGMGHPLFDLASLSAGARFGEDEDARLLEAYRGEVLPREFEELGVFKAASALREALWALIQTVASDLEFDYQAYAECNLLAYARAREMVF
jgi:thiamine kinase-like enzyme